MTNHEYARLLLEQPEMLIYRYEEDREYPGLVETPSIEEDRDPALLRAYDQECSKDENEKCEELGFQFEENPNHPSLMEIRRKYGKMKQALPSINYVVI